jgi:hypothetical protein
MAYDIERGERVPRSVQKLDPHCFHEGLQRMSARVRNALPAGRSGWVSCGWRAWSPLWHSASSRLSKGAAIEDAAAAAVSWSERLEPGAPWRGVCPCVGVSQGGPYPPPMAGSPRPGLLLGSAWQFSGLPCPGIRDRTPLMRPAASRRRPHGTWSVDAAALRAVWRCHPGRGPGTL